MDRTSRLSRFSSKNLSPGAATQASAFTPHSEPSLSPAPFRSPGDLSYLRSRYFSFPSSEGLVPRGQCGFQLPSPILQGCFLASLLVPVASSWVSMQQSLRQGLCCGKCFWRVLLNADGDTQVKEFAMGVGLGFQGKALPPREGKAKGGGIPFLMVRTVPSVPSWDPGRCGFQPTGTAYWHVFGAVINLCVKGVP